MEFKEGRIILDKQLSLLDEFVLDFVRHLSDYVLVSGYVSILFGRSRGSEDIDIIIPVMSEKEVLALFDRLVAEGFDCINESREKAYECLSENIALRFARRGQVIPNMEVKFAKSMASKLALKDAIDVILNGQNLKISPIELQIAYKRICLGSQKDLEDARHLEIVFDVDKERIKKYGGFLKEHGC